MMTFNEIKIKTAEEVAKLKAAPAWRRNVIIAAFVFGVLYFLYSIFWPASQKPSAGFVAAKPAISVQKVAGPTIKVPIRILPKKVVQAKFKDLTPAKIEEEYVDTAVVPPAPNGATVVVKTDTITGITTSEVKIKEAPWFTFERGNTIGGGYAMGTRGNSIPIYYQRDLARIKDFHIKAEVRADIMLDPREKSEVKGAILGEQRFDWP